MNKVSYLARKVSKENYNKDGEFLGVNPYVRDIPILVRPHEDMAIPEDRDEKLYCWFYWLEKILDPSQTGYVLDILVKIPEFEADWGASWSDGEKMSIKTETFINKNTGLINSRDGR